MHIPINSDLADHQRLTMVSQSVFQVMAGCVQGDIAEFGVGRGNSLAMLAKTIARCDPLDTPHKHPPRILHAFDSFQGLPEATAPQDTASPMVQAGIWNKGSCSSPGLAEATAKARASLAGRLRTYDGWFADTLPLIPAKQRFALVHLDCDLYESTAVVLEALFAGHHISDGCILLFDDFLENRGSPRLGQRAAWEDYKRRYLGPPHTDLGYYGRAGWRVMIHVG